MTKLGVVFDFGGVFGSGVLTRLPMVRARYGLERSDIVPFFAGPNAVEARLGGRPFSIADMVPLLADGLRPKVGPAAEAAARLVLSGYGERLEYPGQYIDEMVELARAIRLGGARVGLLTNGPSDAENGVLAPVLERVGFDSTVISGRDGVAKPDRAAFDLILRRLGLEPEDVCFLDDDPGNVRAAEALGIKAFAFDGDPTRIREQLLSEGIEA